MPAHLQSYIKDKISGTGGQKEAVNLDPLAFNSAINFVLFVDKYCLGELRR